MGLINFGKLECSNHDLLLCMQISRTFAAVVVFLAVILASFVPFVNIHCFNICCQIFYYIFLILLLMLQKLFL